MTQNLEAAIKWKKNKQGIEDAFVAWKSNEPGSLDRLLIKVRDFAYTKVYHLEYNFKDFGTAETADDWAQEVVIRVWRNLHKFEGDAEAFYHWTHKIAFNRGQSAFNKVLRQKDTKASIFVERYDDFHEGTWDEDNAEIYHDPGGYDGWFEIPASVQGTDRNICFLILEGRTYAQIARELSMTQKAVEVRVYKLRQRLPAEKEATKEKFRREREAAEKERRESMDKGLARLRASKAAQLAAAD